MKKLKFIVSAAIICSPLMANANNTSYILAARQINLFAAQDRVADMAANVNTTGFKAEKDVFGELPKNIHNREKLSFSQISTTTRDTTQGGMVSTGRALDAAIKGAGYFMVRGPYGDLFTRAGNFAVSPEGVLVTQEGYPVIGGGGGQVEFSETDSDIVIHDDGLVTANREERGQIGVFVFENEQSLVRAGKGYYISKESPQVAINYIVAQGMLEESNVNSVSAMTNLIEVSRGIEKIKKLQDSQQELQLNIIRSLSRY